jgi:hypothetical protein
MDAEDANKLQAAMLNLYMSLAATHLPPLHNLKLAL